MGARQCLMGMTREWEATRDTQQRWMQNLSVLMHSEPGKADNMHPNSKRNGS